MKKSFLLTALLSSFGAPLMAATFIADYVPAPLSGSTLPSPVAPGLYVQILHGVILVANQGGGQTFAAGQSAYVPSAALPPFMVPSNPQMQFTPPPTFQAPAAGPMPRAASMVGAVDCEVR